MFISTYLNKTMIALSGGNVDLRDDRLKKSWQELIAPFYSSKYLVTQEFYRFVTSQAPSTFIGATLPVETVSWIEAAQFCNTLSYLQGFMPYYVFSALGSDITINIESNGYRLLTEAEWVYACKATTQGVRYGLLDQIAWYKDNAKGSTHPVGLKEPNPWGLYDMLGNVWEWCSDVYDETIYGTYRVIKGGGWSDEERSCLATNRRRSHPTAFKIDDLGFRIARSL